MSENKTEDYAYVGDLVVDLKFQGQGIARWAMKLVLYIREVEPT